MARALFDCFYTGWIDIDAHSSRSQRTAIPTAKELFDKAVESFGTKHYLEFWIDEMPLAEPNDPKYAVRKEARLVYDSWVGFEGRVTALVDSPARSEFLEFYALFKGTQFNQYVAFEFKILRH